MDRESTDKPSEPRHPIRIVAERTGLTPATLRAWERRYGAVAPGRSGGAQRLYSDDDIQRLSLIARLASVGYSLADLARTSTVSLARMARQSPVAQASPADEIAIVEQARTNAQINRLLADTRELDAVALGAGLMQAVFTLGPLAALDTIISPFLEQIGVAWACHEVSVAQEHLASAVVRDVLGWMLQTATRREDAPTLVATTVADELHEFGAMMAAIVAAVEGWRVIYLGPNLPAAEIARTAKAAEAQAVVLSVVNPQPTRPLRDELTALRRALGKRTTVIAGGASAADHRLTLSRSSIEHVESRAAFRSLLRRYWTGV